MFRSEDFLDVTEEEFDQLMDINVKGVFFGAQAAARRMVEGEGGSIINMSSVAGLLGSGEYVTYCTSKGAVRLLTYSLAGALGPQGIRVNAIHPGIIETTMTTEDVPIVGTEAGEAFLETVPLGRNDQPRGRGRRGRVIGERSRELLRENRSSSTAGCRARSNSRAHDRRLIDTP